MSRPIVKIAVAQPARVIVPTTHPNGKTEFANPSTTSVEKTCSVQLVGVTLGGIETDAHGKRWRHLIGKIAKAGKVVLAPFARFALDQYLIHHGLPVSPARSSQDTPPLGHLDVPGGVNAQRLREVLNRFFHTAADAIEVDHPVLSSKLRRATPHRMRHTHATHARANGATLTTARDNLRHASITTTSS
ncbi:site-specific integrase [Burkholderia cepacia]|uniref:site-specific integrase n=1 Tax=Burkholderia cepacia TaxID=292 RepID=UPI001FC817B6|nr:site-specific integrase [Burkholderia cepacia]